MRIMMAREQAAKQGSPYGKRAKPATKKRVAAQTKKAASKGPCQWFAMCDNPATSEEPHPILGKVPICKRCQDKVASIKGSTRSGKETAASKPTKGKIRPFAKGRDPYGEGGMLVVPTKRGPKAGRIGGLIKRMTAADISKILGFQPEKGDPKKSDHQYLWNFKVKGQFGFKLLSIYKLHKRPKDNWGCSGEDADSSGGTFRDLFGIKYKHGGWH